MIEPAPKNKTPKKRKPSTLSKKFTLRFKNEEHAKHFAAAKELNLKPAEYLRMKIGSGTIIIRYIDVKFEKMIYEINMIGRNLRQAVTLFYKHNDPAVSIPEIEKTIAEINIILASAKGELKAKGRGVSSTLSPENQTGKL